MDQKNITIGSRIKFFRTSKEMSQEALGNIINLNRAHISNIENGRFLPTLDAIIGIANALDVSVDDLLGETISNSKSAFISEPDNLLLDCTPEEKAILISNMNSLKNKLREYTIK